MRIAVISLTIAFCFSIGIANAQNISDNCPCDADFLLEQISADTLEGTVKINRIVKKGFSKEVVSLGCEGKIVLRKQDASR